MQSCCKIYLHAILSSDEYRFCSEDKGTFIEVYRFSGRLKKNEKCQHLVFLSKRYVKKSDLLFAFGENIGIKSEIYLDDQLIYFRHGKEIQRNGCYTFIKMPEYRRLLHCHPLQNSSYIALTYIFYRQMVVYNAIRWCTEADSVGNHVISTNPDGRTDRRVRLIRIISCNDKHVCMSE